MSGKAVAEPAIPLMKSRRRIAGSLPRYADDGFQRRDYSRDLRSAEWGSMINLRCKSLRHRCPLWVRSGHGAIMRRMSALPPKADIASTFMSTRPSFVPQVDDRETLSAECALWQGLGPTGRPYSSMRDVTSASYPRRCRRPDHSSPRLSRYWPRCAPVPW